LRILYHHRTAASDGMRVHITEVVSALRAQGHVVCVVGPEGADEGAAGAGRLERLADRIRILLPPAGFELLELLYNAPAYLRLKREAKAFEPDVLYERYNLFLLAGLALTRRRRIPMLLEVNSPLAAERAALGRLTLRRLARWSEARLWRGADAVLPVTKALAESVASVRGDAVRLLVVPNGVDPDSRPDPNEVEAVRESLELPSDALVLGFVGFVRAWHGVGWAIDALGDLPTRTHLLIVGDGPALGELQAKASAMGVADRVHFIGRVPHDRVAPYTELFDVALQSAAVSYASPLKLFEYMGHGRAIIAPDQPNIREVLTDGVNALLFRPNDACSFSAALGRLCRDDALRSRLGNQARKTVVDTPYTWAHNAARIAQLAEELLDAYRR
jgi:glycosyltransferase involved in cell wall biosynthesis